MQLSKRTLKCQDQTMLRDHPKLRGFHREQRGHPVYLMPTPGTKPTPVTTADPERTDA